MKIVPATRAMIAEKCPGIFSAHAFAAVDNDELLGLAGIYLGSANQVIFSWIGPKVRENPKAIIQVARKLLKIADGRRMPLMAICDLSIPKADLMMLHFGFRPYKGRIWKYEGRQ